MQDVTKAWRIITAKRRSRTPMKAGRIATYYRHRIGRLPGTPHDIAAGFAIGVGLSMTPFIGLHLVLGLLICTLLRLSNMGMIIGSLLAGNPWTFPFIWLSTYKIGNLLLAKDVVEGDIPPTVTISTLFSHPLELLLPMTVGSLPLGLALVVLAYYPARRIVARYRRKRLAAQVAQAEAEDGS